MSKIKPLSHSMIHADPLIKKKTIPDLGNQKEPLELYELFQMKHAFP